jgi:hypothetical protein
MSLCQEPGDASARRRTQINEVIYSARRTLYRLDVND